MLTKWFNRIEIIQWNDFEREASNIEEAGVFADHESNSKFKVNNRCRQCAFAEIGTTLFPLKFAPL